PVRNSERYNRLVQCIERLWQSRECCVFYCSSCGFGFGVPFKSGDEEFYSILHEQQGYPTWRWEYNLAIRLVIKPSRPGKILDVGAGRGVFLRGLSSAWSSHAIEATSTMQNPLML